MAKTKIDKEMIRDLADLLNETGLNEIEIEQGTLRVRVVRNGGGGGVVAAPAPQPAPAPAPVAEEPKKAAGAVPSPMVGTAYLAPEPGASRFIEIGAQVSAGQTCMIIEAMKTMNPITAPKAGKVTAILIDDGQPVEYGEPLFVIE